MSARTRAGTTTGLAICEAVVDALSDAGFDHDLRSRQLLLNLVRDALDEPLIVTDHSIGRNHLIELVMACAVIANGLQVLNDAVSMMRPGSKAAARVGQLVLQPQAMDLLPDSELERLQVPLADTHVPHLATLVRRAAGNADVPVSAARTAWQALLYLADLNAGPDGFPPALIFVELVARQLGGPISKELHRWNDEQACRLHLETELQAHRDTAAPVSHGTKLHLLIVIQHDGIDPNRWLMSHWRQDDPDVWPPANCGTTSVPGNELERATDALVVSAEQAWSQQSGTAAIEFVLPRALFGLPVHTWCKERDSGLPKPLFLDYPVVLRSLERMRSPHWHRVWRRRWHRLISSPSAARIHLGQSAGTGGQHRIDAILNDPELVMMVLAATPAAEARSAPDELMSALRSGLPALAWHPSAPPAQVYEILMSLTSGDGGLADLPGQVHLERNKTLSESADAGLITDLVLLWDDPFRLVVVDLAPGQPLKGERG